MRRQGEAQYKSLRNLTEMQDRVGNKKKKPEDAAADVEMVFY